MPLRGNVEESERELGSFQESLTQPILSVTRNGEVGRPRLQLAQEFSFLVMPHPSLF